MDIDDIMAKVKSPQTTTLCDLFYGLPAPVVLVTSKMKTYIMVTYVAYRGPHLQSKELHDHCQDGRSRLGTACPLPEQCQGQ